MSETRPLTDPERRTLEWHVSQCKGPGLKHMLGCATYGAGCITVPIGTLVILSLNELESSDNVKIATALGMYGSLWVILMIQQWIERIRTAAKSAEQLKAFRNDLEGGVARIHRFRAEDILLGYEPGRVGRCYFVLLENQNIMVLQETKPQGCDVAGMPFSPDERGFPSKDFEICVSPDSGIILLVVGTGEYLRPADEFELGDGELPTPWRFDEIYRVEGSWKDIRKEYG